MSPYTVCVAVAAAVRMRLALDPPVWGALMRRVAATAADMDATSAVETIRMFAHLAPPWKDAPQRNDPGPRTHATDTAAVHGRMHGDHATAIEIGSRSASSNRMDHSGGVTRADGVDHGAWPGHGGVGRDGDVSLMGAPEGPLAGVRCAAHSSRCTAAAEASVQVAGVLQESLDVFLGGSSGLQVVPAELDRLARGSWAADGSHLGGCVGVWPHMGVNGADGSGRWRKRHARVLVADALPERPWRRARAALEARLALPMRKAALLRRRLLQESARDLQLNVWERERREARLAAPLHLRRGR